MNTIQKVETAAQIRHVADLARDIWTEHYEPIVGLPQVEYMLGRFQSEDAITRQIADESYEYYLAPGAGYLGIVPEPENNRLFLSKIYVRKNQRGTGLGKQFIQLAVERAKAFALPEIWLTVNIHNTATIAFYEHHGFRKAKALATDIGSGYLMDDWHMVKTITQVGDK